MTTPRTRLGEARNDFERELLRSWDSEAPSDSARGAALGLLGSGAAATALAAAAATATPAVATTAVASLAGGSIAPKATALGAIVVTKWMAAGATLLALAGGVAYTRSTLVHTTVAAAPPSAAATSSGRASVPLALPERVTLVPSSAAARGSDTIVAEPAKRSPVAASSARTEAQASPERTTLGLGEQVNALGLAHDALSAGDSANALRLIDAYELQFPNGLLAQESMALRIEALVQRGDVARANRLADGFLSANPSSPHAARLRRLLAR